MFALGQTTHKHKSHEFCFFPSFDGNLFLMSSLLLLPNELFMPKSFFWLRWRFYQLMSEGKYAHK